MKFFSGEGSHVGIFIWFVIIRIHSAKGLFMTSRKYVRHHTALILLIIFICQTPLKWNEKVINIWNVEILNFPYSKGIRVSK